MSDRTYWSTGGAWHALRLTRALYPIAVCGVRAEDRADFSDRVPSYGHLCGRCSRSIAAATDIETPGDADFATEGI